MKSFLNILIFIFSILSDISGHTTNNNTVGLLLNNKSQSFDGYTLFAPLQSKTTYLIDNDGHLVHKWESDFVPGLSTYLLENGNLLRTANLSDPTGQSSEKGGFELIDWDNNIIWQFYCGGQHHDVEYLPNGNILMIVIDKKGEDSAMQAGRNHALLPDAFLKSLSIIEIKQTGLTEGEIIWQWNAWDHLIQDFDSSKDNYGVVADHPELIDINYVMDSGSANWLHTNSVAYNKIFDQIAISNRGTSELWIIDHSTSTAEAAEHQGGNSGKGGDLLYRWGNPTAYRAGTEKDQMLFSQHDVHWISDNLDGEGNLLIFNNGNTRGYTSIEELKTPADDAGIYTIIPGHAFRPDSVAWTYKKRNFNSGRYGGVQRLPNGNTLICNSLIGEFFEVTSFGEVVWRYQNPVNGNNILNQGEKPEVNLPVFRCYKYSPNYPGLIDKDLIPGNPIELYSNVAIKNDFNDQQFKVFSNFPNPFNPSTTITYWLDKYSKVNINIYDVSGVKVKTLVNANQLQGQHYIQWNGSDQNNQSVPAGIYIGKAIFGNKVQTTKLLKLN